MVGPRTFCRGVVEHRVTSAPQIVFLRSALYTCSLQAGLKSTLSTSDRECSCAITLSSCLLWLLPF
jgi:hypothetical protein